jgi:hypothetical protein
MTDKSDLKFKVAETVRNIIRGIKSTEDFIGSIKIEGNFHGTIIVYPKKNKIILRHFHEADYQAVKEILEQAGYKVE